MRVVRGDGVIAKPDSGLVPLTTRTTRPARLTLPLELQNGQKQSQ
jgi:hypothetical protein